MAMEWCITVMAADAVLFAGKTPSETEIIEVAREAARRRPSARILLRHPMGRLYQWAGGSLTEIGGRP